MTRDDIVEIAARHADKHTVGRMKLVMDKFKTVSEFLAADDGALMGAYNAAKPGRPHGLGRQFFRAMDAVRRDAGVIAFLKRGIAEEVAKAKAEDAARPQAPVLLPVPSRFYTLAQLKAVVSFMEPCGIQQIDIDAMERFCRAMKVDIYAAIGGLNA